MAFSKLTIGRMLDWIRACIDKGIPAPTDAEIQEHFGFDNVERARTLLAELADRGAITIQRVNGDRVGITMGRKSAAALIGVGRPTPTIKTPQPPRTKPRLEIMREILARRTREATASAVKASKDDTASQAKPVAATPAPLVAPAAIGKPAPRRQINFDVDAPIYEVLVAEAEKSGIAPGRRARERFLSTFDVPAKKPLISAAVAAAAVERGQPLHEFVAALIQIGFAEHKRQSTAGDQRL
ncbi:hypothetical protein [Sphingomonas sp. MMS24-J13]|uniref:hypothetical protein n=1 Tax=Sphingomonas sp. MMS24-J13 TaxID=3238686 RepID=UPI00384D9CA2